MLDFVYLGMCSIGCTCMAPMMLLGWAACRQAGALEGAWACLFPTPIASEIRPLATVLPQSPDPVCHLATKRERNQTTSKAMQSRLIPGLILRRISNPKLNSSLAVMHGTNREGAAVPTLPSFAIPQRAAIFPAGRSRATRLSNCTKETIAGAILAITNGRLERNPKHNMSTSMLSTTLRMRLW